MQIPSQVINAEDEKYNSIPFSMYSILWGDLEKWEIIKLQRKLPKRNLYHDNLSSKCKHRSVTFLKDFLSNTAFWLQQQRHLKPISSFLTSERVVHSECKMYPCGTHLSQWENSLRENLLLSTALNARVTILYIMPDSLCANLKHLWSHCLNGMAFSTYLPCSPLF